MLPFFLTVSYNSGNTLCLQVFGDEQLSEAELEQWLRFAMFLVKMFDNPKVDVALLDDHEKEL